MDVLKKKTVLEGKINNILTKIEEVNFLNYDFFCVRKSQLFNYLINKKFISIDDLDEALETAIFNYAREEYETRIKGGYVIYSNNFIKPEFVAYSVLSKRCFTNEELKNFTFTDGETIKDFPKKYGVDRNWPAELREKLLKFKSKSKPKIFDKENPYGTGALNEQ